jgi:hypothetical protein
VTCTATNSHGESTTGTFLVQVQYSWSGFLRPIDPGGTSVFHRGRTIPVRFRLTDESRFIRDAQATLWMAPITSTGVGTAIPATTSRPEDCDRDDQCNRDCDDDPDDCNPDGGPPPANSFRYRGRHYVFYLDTSALSAGPWQLSVVLGDGVSRTVTITLQ